MKKILFCLLSYCCGMPFFVPGQSIRTTLLSSATIAITNDSLQKNYTNITLRWQLLVNGSTRRKGSVPGLTLFPGRSRTVRLPLKPPTPGEETFIRVDYSRAAHPAPSLAAQTLPWTTWGGDLRIAPVGVLVFTDSNDVFTISSPAFNLSFDKESGWIRKYLVADYSLLADSGGLRPSLPATPRLQLFSTSTGSQMVIVRTEYTLPELSSLLHLSYTINAQGALCVEQTLETDTSRRDSISHSILRCGMNWHLPFTPDSLTWYGMAGDDRTDTTPSIHHTRIPTDALASGSPVTSHPAPSAATSVRWWSVRDRSGKGFQLMADSLLLYKISFIPDADLIRIEGPLPSPTTLPARYHFAYKLTPVTSNR